MAPLISSTSMESPTHVLRSIIRAGVPYTAKLAILYVPSEATKAGRVARAGAAGTSG